MHAQRHAFVFSHGSFGSTQHNKMMLKEDEGLVATMIKHADGILFQEFSQPFHLGSHGSLLQIPRPNRVIGMTVTGVMGQLGSKKQKRKNAINTIFFF